VDFNRPAAVVACLVNADDVVPRRGSDKIQPRSHQKLEIATPQKGT
jgi:hypothetical protein